MNKTCKIVFAQLLEQGKNQRTFAALLLGAALVCYYSSGFLRFANAAVRPVNLLECYIINGSCRNNFTCITLFVCLMLTFDAPFLSQRSIYEIARVGRQKWFTAQLFVLFLEVLGYNLLVLAFTALLTLCSANSLVLGEWSSAMEWLTGPGQVSALNIYGLYFPYQELLTILSPWAAARLTLLLNSGYCMVLILVMMNCNLFLGSSKGWVAAAGIHILGYVVSNNGGGVVFGFDFSLLDCALPAHQFSGESNMEAVRSAIMFAVLVLGLMLLTRRLGKRWLA